jgi:hypothetical protein
VAGRRCVPYSENAELLKATTATKSTTYYYEYGNKLTDINDNFGKRQEDGKS